MTIIMHELGISFLTNHFKPDWNGRYITSIARCWCPPSSHGIVQWRPSTRKSGWGLRQQTWGDCFCCKNITWVYPHNTYFNVYMYSFYSLLHTHAQQVGFSTSFHPQRLVRMWRNLGHWYPLLFHGLASTLLNIQHCILSFQHGTHVKA